MIRLLSESRRFEHPPPVAGDVLSYYTARQPQASVASLYSNGLVIALISGVLGLSIAIAFATVFSRFFQISLSPNEQVSVIVGCIGAGTILRLMSDAPGSLMQA